MMSLHRSAYHNAASGYTPMAYLKRHYLPLLALFSLSAASAPLRGQPRHLFLDPATIVESTGVKVTVNAPSQSEVVIRADQPWEQLLISFYTTVRDEDGKLRLWYICRDSENTPNVAYAESADGHMWTKPNLGIVNYKGTTANNLVGISNLEGAVYRDPNGEGDQRYIYVSSVHKSGGIFRFTSPDGLRWKRDPQPLLPFESDSHTVVFWEPTHKKYVIYLRGWGARSARDDRRKVIRLEAASLSRPLDLKPAGLPHHANDPQRQPWINTEAPTVLACDLNDPAGVDVYTNSVQPYPLDPSWYVGFPAFYRHFPRSPHRNDGRTEIQFVGSRDGVDWQRYNREVYAEPGLPGPHSGSMIYMGTGLVVRGDEIWQYGTRYRTTHGDVPARAKQTDGAIYRFVQRVDGFVSLDSANQPGRALTTPVSVNASRLLLNVDTRALGTLRVGILNADRKPVPGYTAEECDPVQINATGIPVTWGGKHDLSALKGQKVQLEFQSTRTKLYSFRFE